MSRQARTSTGPEIALRKLLHAAGIRYRINYPAPNMVRRTIDIAIVHARVAVFVDGCYWHGCTEHKTIPKANRTWWREKIAKNRQRDRETAARLTEQGWTVVRVWEHDPALEAASRVAAVIQKSREVTRRS